MTVSHWLCLTCQERGEYVEPETKTDTSPAAKHLGPTYGKCVGATVTSTHAELLDRIAGRAS